MGNCIRGKQKTFEKLQHCNLSETDNNKLLWGGKHVISYQ